MNVSPISKIIRGRKIVNQDAFAEAVVDLCFVTPYKMEELIIMPQRRLMLLLERFCHHYSKKSPKPKKGVKK